MKQCETIYPPVTPFERQTGCCPLIMATLMLDQLKNYFWTELPDDYADEVAQKAEIVFAGNARWRKKFKGRRGREYLEMFLRHWLAGVLARKNPVLFRQLPESYKIGHPLPQKPNPVTVAQGRRTDQNLKPRRSQTTAVIAPRFVHGCELLPI